MPITENSIRGIIVVVQAPGDDPTPRTHYRPSAWDPYFVQLTARDRDWARISYQFAHELYHVLSEYGRLRNGPNNWFHEAICELTSVFSLRRMAECWFTCPPYSNWTGYAGALASYAKDILSCKERQLPTGATLREWLSSREEDLRRNPRPEKRERSDCLLPLADVRERAQGIECRPQAA